MLNFLFSKIASHIIHKKVIIMKNKDYDMIFLFKNKYSIDLLFEISFLLLKKITSINLGRKN